MKSTSPSQCVSLFPDQSMISPCISPSTKYFEWPLRWHSTSMDVDVDSVETELNVYTSVQQLPLDKTLWCGGINTYKLTAPATSVSPESLFSSVGLVKSDFRGNLLDTTLIDVTQWCGLNKHPEFNLKQNKRNYTHTHTHTPIHTHTYHCHWHTLVIVTDTH